jgi:hypothetical protein
MLGEVAEQVALLALLCVVFAEILPNVGATPTQVTLGVAAIVAANAAISVVSARRGREGRIAGGARFAALVVVNLGLVFAASALLSDRQDFQLGAGCFFAFLITLIIWLYDVFKPVHDARFGA